MPGYHGISLHSSAVSALPLQLRHPESPKCIEFIRRLPVIVEAEEFEGDGIRKRVGVLRPPSALVPRSACAPGCRNVKRAHGRVFPDSHFLNFRTPLDRQLAFRDGRLQLHKGPGLGVGFDEEKVVRFAIDPAQAWTRIGS
jgi:hypothetical protein